MEKLKPQINQPPEHNTRLLEHLLVNGDKHHKLNQSLQEVQLLQNEKNKQLDRTLSEHRLILADKSNQLQEQTISILEQLVEKIGTLDKDFKELFRKEKIKSFSHKESVDKKKLELSGEISGAFKDLKTKLNYYNLLLKQLKYGRQN